jgi:hypothetical protein
MFILRFFAGPIVERISPLGLLFASGILGASGLTLLSFADSLIFCVIAATVYALGKTFLWPTMLAVVSEQFPKGGAITIGAIGGVGMLSAGLLGGPGIGFQQDKYASEKLQETNAAIYERYKAPGENEFLIFKTNGLDGAKVGVLNDKGQGDAKEAIKALKVLKDTNATADSIANQQKLVDWWKGAEKTAKDDAPLVTDASLHGSRMALRLTAAVPACMAVLYLLMIFYFKSKGGYKAQEIHSAHEEGERMSGGIEGPAEF